MSKFINTIYFCAKYALVALVLSTMVSCDDDEMLVLPSYEVPAIYDFENVSYTGQLHRLAMMSEWKSYMSESQTQGVAIDADRMKAMFANEEGAGFLQEYTKQIKSKTFENVQADFDVLIEALAMASNSTEAGSDGVAGVIESLDGEKSYLVAANGLDYAQLIEKGLMGACFYYQGTSVYLSESRMNVDNVIIEQGEGTTMEHHWDEAFGYFGVPTDFPSNLDGLVFWGDYANKRNAILNTNQRIMDAFLKGRAAISNNDLDTRDRMIVEVRRVWEEIAAASAIHYLNVGIDNFEDMALRSHALSEAIGFIYALQFNEAKTITNAQVDDLLTLIGGAGNFADMHLYNRPVTDMDGARTALAAIYNWDESTALSF